MLEESRKETAPAPLPASGPELASMMKIGTRVMRGQDWKWGDQVRDDADEAKQSDVYLLNFLKRRVLSPGCVSGCTVGRSLARSGSSDRRARGGRMDPCAVGHRQHKLLQDGQRGQIRSKAGRAPSHHTASHRGLGHGGRHRYVHFFCLLCCPKKKKQMDETRL